VGGESTIVDHAVDGVRDELEVLSCHACIVPRKWQGVKGFSVIFRENPASGAEIFPVVRVDSAVRSHAHRFRSVFADLLLESGIGVYDCELSNPRFVFSNEDFDVVVDDVVVGVCVHASIVPRKWQGVNIFRKNFSVLTLGASPTLVSPDIEHIRLSVPHDPEDQGFRRVRVVHAGNAELLVANRPVGLVAIACVSGRIRTSSFVRFYSIEFDGGHADTSSVVVVGVDVLKDTGSECVHRSKLDRQILVCSGPSVAPLSAAILVLDPHGDRVGFCIGKSEFVPQISLDEEVVCPHVVVEVRFVHVSIVPQEGRKSSHFRDKR
jgi:hypothetical protein